MPDVGFRSQIMGILNVTPDSFSDGGQYLDVSRAIAHGLAMAAEGADIIDVGGESTRPGADPVAASDEIARIRPVVAGLREQLPAHVEISIDTIHESVANVAVSEGATIINDVAAALGHVAAELQVGWIAMHRQGTPQSMQLDPWYEDVVSEVLEFLTVRADAARRAGCPRIWIDPGFGFGKTIDHNLDLLAHLDRFVRSPYPVAVGLSRKSLLATLLAESDGVDFVPLDDRLEGSLASATWAMVAGVALVRAHDVRPTVQAAQVVWGTMPETTAA